MTSKSSGQDQPFIPFDFQVPIKFENAHFRIRTLTVNDVVKDYDAVMTSIDHLQQIFPNSNWPQKEMTFEQNLIDLGWHQKEFQLRRSFAFTVVRLDESEVIGSLYINPTKKGDFEVSITMWVRASVMDQDMDAILFQTVKTWIKTDWPFIKIAYPGREISWKEWKTL
jgi:hypothetical protein